MQPRHATIALLSFVAILSTVTNTRAQDPDAGVKPATYSETSASPPSLDQVEVVRQLARHRGGQTAALAQVMQLTREFEDAVAAELIDELASAHVRAGNLDLAATTRQVLAERFPDQPVAQRSLLWLVRLYASAEVAHAQRRQSQGASDLQRQLPRHKAATAGRGPKSRSDEASNDASAAPAPADEPDSFAAYALHIASQAMATNAALANDPALAFQRSVAARKAGQDQAAYISPLKHLRAGDPWADCARAETWLLESKREQSPKRIVTCITADVPPRLDGVLDEPCWQGQPASAASAAEVRWACDETYLYVAVECAKRSGVAYPRDDRPRPHDGDVEAYDRVRLLVDVDRDYATCFELVVDSRGWTADRCWGDVSWNPAWFVAAGETTDGAAWTAEAAIPLDQLTNTPGKPQHPWACAVERFAPSEDGSPAKPPADPSPEQFGLLLFD